MDCQGLSHWQDDSYRNYHQGTVHGFRGAVVVSASEDASAARCVSNLNILGKVKEMSGLNSIQIQALVRDMDTSMRRHKGLKRTNQVKFREKIVEENKHLHDVFPTIFEMHYQGKMDTMFFDMLKLRRKIELGEITEDDASKLVGQQLFDRYVAPVVGETPAGPVVPKMSYEDYYKQFDAPQDK